MSWVTDKATITTAFGTAGYREVPNQKDLEHGSTTFKNKAYELRPIGAELQHYSNSSTRATHRILLRVGYINRSSTKTTIQQRDINFDLFMTLLTTLNGLSVFMSFITDPTFTDVDEHKSIGEIEFYCGAREC